ncbi:MAG TPA: hypothetical protein VG826_09690 [Pirellulales bacterium]|nr:hypothetical protein [Pirellulales bacterium]
MSAERGLQLLLRGLGVFDLLALGGVIMPQHCMAIVHAWLGMGELPRTPVVDYLARSASLMYAQHAVVFLFLSTDVRRYRPLIVLMAIIAIVSGLAMLTIDLMARIPLFWTVIEGPGYVVLASTVLVLQRRLGREADSSSNR